ncbi:hypothetical protein D3C77_587200 [compost metagenome]
MATAVGDEHRRQFPTNLDAIEHHAIEHLLAGLAKDDVKTQAFAELSAEVRNAGVTRQQQPLRSAHTQAHADGVTFHPRALAMVIVQAALAIRHTHFA